MYEDTLTDLYEDTLTDRYEDTLTDLYEDTLIHLYEDNIDLIYRLVLVSDGSHDYSVGFGRRVRLGLGTGRGTSSTVRAKSTTVIKHKIGVKGKVLGLGSGTIVTKHKEERKVTSMSY